MSKLHIRMNASAPSFEDGVASHLVEPYLSWIRETVDSFVGMASLQPGSSVLDLGCGTARVAIAARNVLGTSHGRVVAIDTSHGSLQEAQRQLERAHLDNEITLLHGDIRGFCDIEGLRLSGSASKPTFDVIFARNIFNLTHLEQTATILRH